MNGGNTMKKVDFNILENADKETVEKLSERYNVIDNDEKERIYNMIQKRRMGIAGFENGEQVNGVEVYNRPVWYKIAAFAASFMLIAGIGAVGAMHLNGTQPDPLPTSSGAVSVTTTTITNGTTIVTTKATTTASAETSATNASTSAVTATTAAVTTKAEEQAETATPGGYPLQMHELITADSDKQALELGYSHSISHSRADRHCIDVDYYANKLMNSSDFNTLENKSYIYHMILNSSDYCDTVKYTKVNEVYDPSKATLHVKRAEYEYDYNKNASYYKNVMADDNCAEYYCIDGKTYMLFNDANGESSYTLSEPEYTETSTYPEDNYRVIKVTGPYEYDDNNYDYLKDISYKGMYYYFDESWIAVFGPETEAKQLCDFSTWSIDHIENISGRECAYISFRDMHGDNAELAVDIKTGIVMREKYQYTGSYVESIEVNSACDNVTIPDVTNRKKYDHWVW